MLSIFGADCEDLNAFVQFELFQGGLLVDMLMFIENNRYFYDYARVYLRNIYAYLTNINSY